MWLSQLLCHSYFWIGLYDGVCKYSHVIILSQWKEGEKIAGSGARLPHFQMFTSFVGMCICTYGEHESANENTNQAPFLKAQECQGKSK